MPVIAGFHKDRLGITNNGAFAAFIVGGTSGIFWLKIVPRFDESLAEYIDAVIVGVALCSVVLIINAAMSRLAGKSGDRKVD